MTSVVLADDQELVRGGLRALLEARGVEVLAEAEHGRAAVEATRLRRPDVLVMDIRMPVMDGIAATREVVAAGLATRVLILTTYDLDEYVYEALRAGAAGFMLKATPPDRLVDAIDVVAAGEALLAPSLTQRLIAEHVRRPPPNTGIPEQLRRAHSTGARGARVRRPRSLQRRDRGDARRQPRHREDAREPDPRQARAPQPRSGRGHRIRDRPGSTRRYTVRRCVSRACTEPATSA